MSCEEWRKHVRVNFDNQTMMVLKSDICSLIMIYRSCNVFCFVENRNSYPTLFEKEASTTTKTLVDG